VESRLVVSQLVLICFSNNYRFGGSNEFHIHAPVIPRFPSHHLPATNHFPQVKDYQMAKKLKRRAWTKADIRTLKGLAKKKTHASSIARVLKRTEGATRQKSFSMGLSLDSRG
jgi:hypothetical protein